jgi:hypothetical protein
MSGDTVPLKSGSLDPEAKSYLFHLVFPSFRENNKKKFLMFHCKFFSFASNFRFLFCLLCIA